MKKILMIYATAGIGHKKAALAVKAAFDEIPQGPNTAIIDSLDYTNAFFKWSYLKAYLFMVNRIPLIWGFLYYLTDNRYFNVVISKIRRFNNWLNSGRLARYLQDAKPDVIISTHFFASEVISNMNRRRLLDSRLVIVITDYRLHSWWLADPVDAYVVASEDARQDLLNLNVPSTKIKLIGIPVEPIFTKKLDRASIFKRLNLKEDVFTILVVGGGFGVGPIEGIVKVVNVITKPVQLVVICGHNENLVKKLNVLTKRTRHNVKVLGFMNNVYEYMEISSVLISKAGGITVSESLARELPMVIISPIIGQETRNSDFVVSRHAAVKIDGLAQLKGLLEDLIENPAKIEEMRKNIQSVKRPMACYDVANLAMELAGE